MGESDLTGLSLLQRRSLQPFPQHSLPMSPRPIAGETLWSYCMRLTWMFNSDVGTFLHGLGIPPSVPFEVLEMLPCSVLTERLASATGRAIDRFVGMQHVATDDVLKVADRTAFCPRCWFDRQRADAAYLAKTWTRSWVFFCPRHTGQPLHELADGDCWRELFARRSQWAALVHQSCPDVWQQACVTLDLDPVEECANIKQWLRDVQHRMTLESRGCVPGDGMTRVACDLANYLQIEWPYSSSEGTAAIHVPIRVIDDEDTCPGRMLAGSLRYRLRTLILVRHLIGVVCGNKTTPLGQTLAGRLRLKPQAEIDRWWLTRRLSRWPDEKRRCGYELFGLELTNHYAIPAFEACRRCTRAAAAPLPQQGLRFRPDGDFRCLNDAW